ncbi:MAG: efflux RND transporter permease subunit, partial [Deltaproteobacteria bacterium]
KIYSISLEGKSLAIVTLDDDLFKNEKEKIKTDIQRAIDRIDDLPKDAEKPVVEEIRTHDQPLIEISLSGPPEPILRLWADLLKNELELIEGISSVVKSGWRNREYWVEVDPLHLKNYHLSLPQIVAALKAKNVNLPGGALRQPGQEFLVRTIGEIETPDEVMNVVIRSNDTGNANQVKNVATVLDTFSEETVMEKIRGQRAVSLLVLKRAKGDAITIANEVKKNIDTFRNRVPDGLSIEISHDLSYYVKRRLNVLTSNGWFGMFLVIVVLLLFLSKRIALIASLGIPFAFFTTFILMKLFGITLNLVAMFGLIIVSGMLVDDSIIFAENIFHHMQKGKSPKEAALIGASEVILPVLGSVLTTIVAFLPLMFMSGTMGKFTWQISAVVILALLASLFEAIFILPAHCAEWIDPSKEKLVTPSWFERISNAYERILEITLNRKYRVIAAAAIAFAGSLIIGIKVIPFSLFPAKGIEIFFIRANTKIGTPLPETSERFSSIEKIVSELPKEELDTFTTQIGISQQDIHDPFTKRGSHVGQIVVFLTPPSKRKRDADEIIRDLEQKIVSNPSLKDFEFIRFSKVKPGPPIGKEIS